MLHWVWFIIIGVAAGWLAGKVMKGSGFGLLGDLILGAAGGWVGGYVFDFLRRTNGLLGSLLMATVGAILLIVVVRALGLGGRRK